MTHAQSRAYRLRWVILIVGLLCLAVGIAWFTGPTWYDMNRETWLGEVGPVGPSFTPLGAEAIVDPLPGNQWGYYVMFFGLFVVLQGFFLWPQRRWLPDLAQQGRPMKVSLLVAGLMAALLTVGLLATLLEIPNWWMKVTHQPEGSIPYGSGDARDWPAGLAILTAWIVWTVVFFVYWWQGDRYTQLGRMIRGLIAGSILEMLVAIPVQALTYKRDDCYCARGSYTGLVLGGTVLLWAFGPGIVLLFMREKYRRHRLLLTCMDCGYDLRGSVAAGSTTCPESGAEIPDTARGGAEMRDDG